MVAFVTSWRRIIVHAGLPKTGTTTIQAALQRTSAILYPTVERNGPGHAELAWRSSGIAGWPREPGLLCQVVSEREEVEPDRPLVLSSEVFGHAIEGPAQSEALVRLATERPTELIVTLRPDDERIASFAQELVKHGPHGNFGTYWEIAIDDLRMRRDAARRLVELAPWHRIHLIRVDTSRPDQLHDDFEQIIGSPLARGERENARWPRFVIELLHELNRIAEHVPIPIERRRELAWSCSTSVFASQPACASLPYPSITRDVREVLRAGWEDEWLRFRSSSDPRIAIYPLSERLAA